MNAKMKLVPTAAFLACLANGALSVAADGVISFERPKMNQKMAAAMMKINGGVLERKDSYKGKFVILDARKEADVELFRPVAMELRKFCQVNVEIAKAPEGAGRDVLGAIRKSGGNVGVVIVEDQDKPKLIVAPDDGYAVVNASKLVVGVEKSRLAQLRIQKEAMRAVGFVASGMSSQYFESLAGPIANPSELDKYDGLTFPFDITVTYKNYLAPFGVTPFGTATYKKAVQEGWAPQPTNDIQKAIWDKLLAIPQKPIKIEFDPKTDTK